MKKLELGLVVMTTTVCNAINDDNTFAEEVSEAFRRYQMNDWGDMCQEDFDVNNAAVESGEDRVLAVYKTSKRKIYIITEWDRSYTTILFADEY